MERNKEELLKEMRDATSGLNQMSEYLKGVNDKLMICSELRLYAFLMSLADKAIQFHNKNREDECKLLRE